MRIQIPPPDIAVIDLRTGRFTQEWYDVLKALERVGLLDLADVNITAATNGQVPIWSAGSGKFVFGAN